ncbi:MAG: PH domain-containing protein [Dehalococcoidia bacterium]|nr:PH domain-containing protein [Dehalococcoidia bacterium]
MLFRPPRVAPVLVGLGAVLVTLALVATGVFLFLETPISLSSFFLGLWVFLLLVLAALNGWRTWCCWALRYHLTRDALTIHWGHRKEVVPMREFRKLVSSQGKSISWSAGVHGFAHHVGPGNVAELGLTSFYATHLSPANLVYLLAGDRRYGLSLEDPQRFERYLETCLGLGPLSWQDARIEEGRLVHLPFWRDTWALAMLVGAFLINLALFAYLSYHYPQIPSFLALHFAPSGQVDRIGLKLEVFKLPGIALVVLGGNGLMGILLHVKERYMAYLTLVVALLVQMLFWVAAVRIAG